MCVCVCMCVYRKTLTECVYPQTHRHTDYLSCLSNRT